MGVRKFVRLWVALALCITTSISICTVEANAVYIICSCGGSATLYCNYYTFGVSGISSGKNTHKHSGNTCTRTYYKSKGRYKCSSCGKTSYYTNESGVQSRHDCYIAHSYTGTKECGCPIWSGYSPPSFAPVYEEDEDNV